MTLALHPDCRNRLLEQLAESLKSMVVEHRRILPIESIYPLVNLDGILPERHDRIGLVGFFTDHPVMDFVFESVTDELDRGEEFEEEKGPEPLTVLETYADPVAAADALVSEFESLPWEYRIFFRTSFTADFQQTLGSSLQLGSDLRLILMSEADMQRFEFPADISISQMAEYMYQRTAAREWDKTKYYLEFTVHGFIGRIFGTDAVEYAKARIKAFSGLALVLELASLESRGFDTWNRSPLFVFTSKAGGSANLRPLHWFSDDDARQLQSLRSPYPSDPRGLPHRFDLLKAPFEAGQATLLNAARWFFDAHSGSNEVLSFVQAMVVLEILFGDKATADVIGIGRLIANRCAYSIGGTLEEREQIISDFDAIYSTRSEIVHRGKDKLTSAEKQHFSRLKELCRRALWRELVLAARPLPPLPISLPPLPPPPRAV